ncbi:DeoR/GlpR family DNA-binding transcription regulator [Paenibacillus hamazuiensis]|uniref:DeoR/GlpR family DNA-binding transcription regulator n=1 Tax=Paenibacillus hamazuiensis TaxID=2936508 RepID=UPI00200FF22E|nr:DeoR/GlpR family DNA-binding transcription regulator [Paenibacillus hamazuiensis]
MSGSEQSKGDKRREAIMQIVKRQGKISVQEVIDKFDCSEATARRDLDVLVKKEGLIRSLGGVQLGGAAAGVLGGHELPFHEKKQLLWLEKEAIAAKAASMVKEGDIVGLTGGTTTFLIARALKTSRRITVVTNAVNIAMELAEAEGVQIVLTGGVMRSNSFELCGPLAEKIVGSLHIGLMFMGVDGVTAEHGLTTFSEQEADIARLMMGRAVRTVAVFDHTKVGRTSLFCIAPLESVSACITDAALPEALAGHLERQGVALHVAELSAAVD